MNKTLIELENEVTIGFLIYGQKYFEYLAPYFRLDFPNLTEEDYREFASWADSNANMLDGNEFEYIFTIAYWDNNFLKYMAVPEKLRPIFRAVIKQAKLINKEIEDHNKIVPCLRLWLPKT